MIMIILQLLNKKKKCILNHNQLKYKQKKNKLFYIFLLKNLLPNFKSSISATRE